MSGSFDCTLSLGALRDGDRIDLVADDQERLAIADRLGLTGIEALKAHAVLHREGDTIHAEGRIQAACTQACIATGEPVPERVDEAFDLKFLPEPKARGEEEVELGQDDLDIVFHDGQRIALGDALVDTLNLALDPYPRGPNADAALKDAGVLSEEEAGPFAALAALKGKMAGE